MIERGALWFPAYLRDDGFGIGGNGIQRRPNLSGTAQRYLHRLGADVEDLFHHVLSTLHDPHLPRGQRRGAPHGMAAHPAAGLARWRS